MLSQKELHITELLRLDNHIPFSQNHKINNARQTFMVSAGIIFKESG